MKAKRGRGRPRGFWQAPQEFKDRFQKYYYTHRRHLNDERRDRYNLRKKIGLCVRCGKKSAQGVVFCKQHHEAHMKYLRGDAN